MDTNSNPNVAMVSTLLDSIVTAIADSVMEKVAARMAIVEDGLMRRIIALEERLCASPAPGADYVTLATRIATIEASVTAVGARMPEHGDLAALITRVAAVESSVKTVSEKVEEMDGVLDEHQSAIDEIHPDDYVTEDRVSDVVADALPDLDEFVKNEDIAQAIEDNLPDDLVRQQALEDAVGTAVSKLRIVIGE